MAGGSTPGPLYAALRQTAISHIQKGKKDQWQSSEQPDSESFSQSPIDFSRVSFFLVDERYVPPTDPKSNVRLVMEELFGQEVWSDPAAGGTMKFRPTANAWPYTIDFSYPDTSLPVDRCIAEYREVGSDNQPSGSIPRIFLDSTALRSGI